MDIRTESLRLSTADGATRARLATPVQGGSYPGVQLPADIKAAVSFYGGGIGTDHPSAPINQASRIQAPVLALWGEKDGMIPLDQVKHVSGTMKRLGKTYEDKVYPGAGHGFFCDERGSYDEASAKDAWTKLTAWFQSHLR